MNSFIQHIPTFIDADPPKPYEFETLEELLNIDVVKQWARPMDGKAFSHFALSDNILLVIHDDSFHWWTVGYIKEPDNLKLPKWNGGKYKAKFPNGQIKIIYSDKVASSCGNILTLKDGTKVKNLNH